MIALRSNLALTPADHVRLLHPVDRKGVATVATRGEKWIENVVPIVDLPAYAAAMRGGIDVYLSQQTFFGWRRIAHLAQLGALYSDLDYKDTDWAGQAPEDVAYAVLRHLDEHRLPNPSYILSTGRGLLVAWLHDMVPRGALPRWMAIQKELLSVLRPFGADPRAIDAARVFRLVGTKHSGTDATVRPLWMGIGLESRWGFDDLADGILPLTRADLTLLRAQRLERKANANDDRKPPAKILTAGTYWEAVLTDLQKIRRHRWFGNLPSGQRDSWLFTAGVAMSWLSPAAVLRRELNALAAEAGGWGTTECDARMGSVIRRAERAARGEKQEWQGTPVDPRYRMKAATIVEWMGINQVEMRQANLRVLIDAEVAREHDAERKEAKRRADGVIARAAYEASSTERQKPWEAIGMSRRSWYRAGKPSAP